MSISTGEIVGRHAAAFALASLIVAAFPAPVSAQTAPVPAGREFQDWIVDCDNTRSCVAVGLTAEDGPEMGFVHLSRAGGGGALPTVTLVLYDDALKPGQPLTIAADTAPIAGVTTRRSTQPIADYDGFAQTVLAPGEVTPFVEALRRANRLVLANPGGESAGISLRGAMAALLFIDDIQGRVGTVTALTRPGVRPATEVPSPPALPVVRPRPALATDEADPTLAARVRERLQRENPDVCDPRDEDEPDMDDVASLGNGRALVGVVCSSGAYNYESIFSIVDGSNIAKAQPARFAAPPVDGVEPKEVSDSLINADFDAATGRLSFFSKGRGLGDCGTSGEYAWTGEGFTLLAWRSMPECRGVPEPFWPVLWRTETR